MSWITLDFDTVTDRESLHWLLQSEMHLPAYYGANLDALWDCLMEITEETTLDLRNVEKLKETLDNYSDKLLITLYEASQANPHLSVQRDDVE